MDIEELSKAQIVLLTLLVSFVTSIATGIVTVSLMDQAPPAIAQTVNRVIERTVEKVVPSAEGQSAATVVTTEKTVVVKESDLIVQAVEKVAPSLAKIYTTAEEGTFLGLGIVLDDMGTVVTDSSALGGVADATIELSDGSSVRAFVVSRDKDAGTAVLRAASTTTSGKPASFISATLAVGSPVLGQTVVALSGRTVPRIADGLVVALIPRDAGEDKLIDTNISTDFIMSGSPLINTEGALVGVSTSVSRASSQKGFVPSSMLVKKQKTSGEGAESKADGE